MARLHELWRIGPIGRRAVPALAHEVGVDLGCVLGHRRSEIVLGSLDDDLKVEYNVLVLGVRLLVGARQTSIRKLPENDAEREDVGLGRVGLTKVHLGGTIGVRATKLGQRASAIGLLGGRKPRESKVRDFDLKVLVDLQTVTTHTRAHVQGVEQH